MNEYYAIKWLDKMTAERHTREVTIRCKLTKGDVFVKDGEAIVGWGVKIEGSGDTEHHIVEDTMILLKKIAEVKCGGGH